MRNAEKAARIEPLPNMLALHGRTLPQGAQLRRALRTVAHHLMQHLTGSTELRRAAAFKLRLAIGAEWPGEVTARRNADASRCEGLYPHA
jgi:hypothetical protein